MSHKKFINWLSKFYFHTEQDFVLCLSLMVYYKKIEILCAHVSDIFCFPEYIFYIGEI